MKVYEFGDRKNPVLLLLPGTCCHWKANFKKVIEPLAEKFYVACVSYDGFDETEKTEFPGMLQETEKIEAYVSEHFAGQVRTVYGCSLGGSFVGLLAARKRIHMDFGILGSSDLDQAGRFAAKLMTSIAIPILYPFLTTGKFKLGIMNRRLERRRQEMGEYVQAFLSMMSVPGLDMRFITKRSAKMQFYSDMITPLPDKISVEGTEIHILYALKMGEKYRARYLQHFADPILHEMDLRHEELLAVYPDKWVELVSKISQTCAD